MVKVVSFLFIFSMDKQDLPKDHLTGKIIPPTATDTQDTLFRSESASAALSVFPKPAPSMNVS